MEKLSTKKSQKNGAFYFDFVQKYSAYNFYLVNFLCIFNGFEVKIVVLLMLTVETAGPDEDSKKVWFSSITVFPLRVRSLTIIIRCRFTNWNSEILLFCAALSEYNMLYQKN